MVITSAATNFLQYEVGIKIYTCITKNDSIPQIDGMLQNVQQLMSRSQSSPENHWW